MDHRVTKKPADGETDHIEQNFFQKTFIDPKLLPYTREFSDKEIDEWLTADKI